MDVELLVIPDCPSESAAAKLLRAALDELGLVSTAVRTTMIESSEHAAARGFLGSPTILIDGVDPFASDAASPVLACRVFPGPAGPTGLPDELVLREALLRAAGRGRTSLLRRRRAPHVPASRGITAVIPEPADQVRHRKNRGSCGGRPVPFDAEDDKNRNVVEHAFNQLKNWRAIATRFDQHVLVYCGSLVLAAILMWLR